MKSGSRSRLSCFLKPILKTEARVNAAKLQIREQEIA